MTEQQAINWTVPFTAKGNVDTFIAAFSHKLDELCKEYVHLFEHDRKEAIHNLLSAVWLYAQEEYKRGLKGNEELLTPTEALYGFMGWLTTRKRVLRLGASVVVDDVPKLIHRFVKANNLYYTCREDWHKRLKAVEVTIADEPPMILALEKLEATLQMPGRTLCLRAKGTLIAELPNHKFTSANLGKRHYWTTDWTPAPGDTFYLVLQFNGHDYKLTAYAHTATGVEENGTNIPLTVEQPDLV